MSRVYFSGPGRWGSASIYLLGILWLLRAQAAEHWMASTDPFGRGPHRPDVAQDYLDLFHPDAPWAEAGRQLTVFKVGPSFVDSAPDDVLRQAFSDLKRRGIALGWEMGAVRSG